MNSIISYIKNYYVKYTTPIISSADEGLNYWREKVLLEVIFALFYFALIAYIPSVILSLAEKLWLIVIADTVVYLYLAYLFFNKNMSVKFRVFSLLMLSYLLGILLVFMLGPYGAGYLWLFIMPILAATLIERNTAIFFLLLNTVSLIVLGVFQHYIAPFVDHSVIFSAASWLAISANFVFLNIIITFSVIILIRGLQQKLKDEKEMRFSLEKRNKEIIAAKEEAVKADRVKTEFLAQISHEIRTPINTILGFTSLIKSSLDGNLTDDQRESFQIISTASKRITRTIDLILNMSELQTASFKPAKRKIDLYNDVLHILLGEFKQAVDEKGLKLSIQNKLDNNFIYADEYTVGQIFANLLDNAVKYTDKGEINVVLINEGDRVLTSIEDTGIGISESYLKNIFTPFSQEDKGYTRQYDGNGLGLTLVKKYCDINNAVIDIKSKKDFGTTVNVKFPTKKESL